MQDFDPSQYGEADRREWIHRLKSSQPRGPQAAPSTGESSNAGSGSDVCAVQTVGNAGSRLQIFVERKSPDHDAFVIRSSALRGVVIEVKAGVTSNHVSCNGRGLKTFDGQIDAQRELK
jgi:hypothetical protein